jgi:hypothetical protein
MEATKTQKRTARMLIDSDVINGLAGLEGSIEIKGLFKQPKVDLDRDNIFG